MNLYEEIEQENMCILLRSLADRTLTGKQKWEGLRYYPIGFVQESDSAEQEAYISQMFEMETEFNGRFYQVELIEAVSLPSLQCEVFGSIYYENEYGECKYDFGIPEQPEEGEEAAGKERESVLRLADATAALFHGTKAEEAGFSYARYFNQKEIHDKWKKDKVVKLGKRLMEEKNMEEFHKIVTEPDYLQKNVLER